MESEGTKKVEEPEAKGLGGNQVLKLMGWIVLLFVVYAIANGVGTFVGRSLV